MEKGGSGATARNPLATSLPPRQGPELGMGREVSWQEGEPREVRDGAGEGVPPPRMGTQGGGEP